MDIFQLSESIIISQRKGKLHEEKNLIISLGLVSPTLFHCYRQAKIITLEANFEAKLHFMKYLSN